MKITTIKELEKVMDVWFKDHSEDCYFNSEIKFVRGVMTIYHNEGTVDKGIDKSGGKSRMDYVLDKPYATDESLEELDGIVPGKHKIK